MTVFKCKMCGGTIEFEQGATVGTCDSCGTKQTLPKLDDDDERIVKEIVAINNTATSVSILSRIKRISLFLEEGEWEKANEYCEKVLDLDPENGEIYLLKELAERQCRDIKELCQFYYSHYLTSYSKNLELAKRFGGREMAEKLGNLENTLKLAALNLLKMKEEEKERMLEEQKRIEAEEKEFEKQINRKNIYYGTQKPQEMSKAGKGCIGCLSVFLILLLISLGIDRCKGFIHESDNAKNEKTVENINKIFEEERQKYAEHIQSDEFRKKETEMLASAKKRTGFQWSKISSDSMNWKEAIEYCKNLNEDSFSDWRLPNIDELRTLIQNCPTTETGGKCEVSEKNGCLSFNCWGSGALCYCEYKANNGGYYSKLGDSDGSILWSSSALSDSKELAWRVIFSTGEVDGSGSITTKHHVRCLR